MSSLPHQLLSKVVLVWGMDGVRVLVFFCFLGGKQFKKTIDKRRPELGEVRLEGDNRPSNPVALTTGLRRDSADTYTTNPLCSAIGSQPFNWT